MKQFTDSLFDKLQDTLRDISSDQDISFIRRSRESVVATSKAILELKQFIVAYEFKDQAEEVQFFKEVLPEFYSLLIYFIRVVSLESRMPAGSKEERKVFFQQEMGNLKAFFDDNQSIYRYYRTEESARDHLYFLRAPREFDPLSDDAILLYDTRFCTEMGYKFARIKANELLLIYIEEKVEFLTTGRFVPSIILKWKPKKVYLAELIYLLWAYGAFGNVRLKTIVDSIGRSWGCQLNNFYKIKEEMRIRKKEKFPFTRQLLLAGERQMDEDDLTAK